MSNLKIEKLDENTRFPLYVVYGNNIEPQRAYIALDLIDGRVYADYWAEVGNGIYEKEHNNTLLTFSVLPCTASWEINEKMMDNREWLEKLYEESKVEFDGANHIGVLPDWFEASDWHRFNTLPNDMIITVEELLSENPFPGTDQSLNTFFKTLQSNDGENNCYFENEMTVEEIKEKCLEYWSDNYLDSGCWDEIPPNVASLMLNHERCDIGAYREELEELAGKDNVFYTLDCDIDFNISVDAALYKCEPNVDNIVGWDSGRFGDCWIKINDKEMISFLDEKEEYGMYAGVECRVRHPGNHPGGNSYWLTPVGEVLCPIWMVDDNE